MLQLGYIKENAELIQEDFDDQTISDDDLSQDSLDLVLERNLFVIPAAELNDMKLRKADRRRKSHRFSAQAFMTEFKQVNDLIGDKASLYPGNMEFQGFAVPVTPQDKPTGLNDLLFFSIDKVENFEVYFPHNNISKLIREFEKKRVQQIELTSDGRLKNMFLKNLNALRKNRHSPLQRRKTVKFNQEDEIPLLSRLQTDMQRVNKEKKELKRKETLKQETEKTKSLRFPRNEETRPNPLNKKAKAKTEDDSNSSDGATLPKEEARYMDRKGTNLTNYMNKINSSLSIRMPSQTMIKAPTELVPSKPATSNVATSNQNLHPTVSDGAFQSYPFESLNLSSIAKIDLTRRMSKNQSSIPLPSVISGNFQDIAMMKRPSIDYHMGKKISFVETNNLERPLGRKTTSLETPIPEYPMFGGKSKEFGTLQKLKPENENAGDTPDVLDNEILLSLLMEEAREENVESNGKMNRGLSYDRVSEMRKVVDRYKIPKVVQKLINDYQLNG